MSRLASLFHALDRHCSLLKSRADHDPSFCKDCEAIHDIWKNRQGVIEAGCPTAGETGPGDDSGQASGSAVCSVSSSFTALQLVSVLSVDHYERGLEPYAGSMRQKWRGYLDRADPNRETSQAESEVETALISLYTDLDPRGENPGSQLTAIEASVRQTLGAWLEMSTL
jgi:hypothetical protein